jgi:hypothetical protein
MALATLRGSSQIGRDLLPILAVMPDQAFTPSALELERHRPHLTRFALLRSTLKNYPGPDDPEQRQEAQTHRPRAPTPASCARCGGAFECGLKAGLPRCWCYELSGPTELDSGRNCYCKQCP